MAPNWTQLTSKRIQKDLPQTPIKIYYQRTPNESTVPHKNLQKDPDINISSVVEF